VGTVDQIFLSVLQTRHFFVRLFGLYGKVIIFDEVHAYDAYQSEIFTRLLSWLRALNISVILLSATLPSKVRSQLITAYAGSDYSQQENTDCYPRLTIVTPSSLETHKLPPPPSKPVNIEWIGETPGEVATYLSKKLEDGGCAAVICNTVARAQMIYQAVIEYNVAPGNTHLFHARFPYIWRKELEDMVLNRYGPAGVRAERSVVIATQVIEQSLDLDFDFMISELAPIDLLIQRAGRLHRHSNHPRPSSLATPCLALMQAALTPDGDPDFGPSSYVYRRYHLLRTQAVLANRSCLQLPEQTPELIERVYGEHDLEVNDQIASLLQKARNEMAKDIHESTRQARNRLIFPPDRDDFLRAHLENLEEEATDIHTAFQALTREAPPGVSLVCLHRLQDGQVVLDPDKPDTVINIGQKPSWDQVKDLLRQVAQVQRFDVVQYFNNQPKPECWAKVAALRYHHLVIFEHGRARLEGTPLILCLDRELGLSFQKEV
ncbi:MAG TPA: CRISPR-associated helicase Cas3', partial [Anaerolineaceae bacterium]|nr:CRISPR-associated helicase Cas3' [Anaerolineaceae bacterium]